MFCKKCHKRIIKVVKDSRSKNKCICNDEGFINVTKEKTELTGIRNGIKKK